MIISGMLSAFGGLSLAQVIAPSSTTMLHQALLPAVAWVGRWLPVFLVPVQVMLPTINFPGQMCVTCVVFNETALDFFVRLRCAWI